MQQESHSINITRDFDNFLGALFYVGRLVYRSFKPGTSGSGSCGAIDFKKLGKELERNRLLEAKER